MNQPKPFDCEYSPQFAELLGKLGISLAVSTYQAGKVIIVSPVDNDRLIQLPRTFSGAMGMAADEDRLAVATTHEVVLLRNEPGLAAGYPTKPGVYDSIYLPRASFYTGNLALHDMAFVNGKLLSVNTLFSSVSEINSESNFTSVWQPPFISDLQPEDRCHLNGMAVADGQIKYVTALGQGNQPHQWRDNKMSGGVLMEYPSGEIILDNLSMPHSPRVYDDELYLLNSAQGELIKVDLRQKSYEVIVSLGGFARGMVRWGDYLFIGVSKLRHNSPVFADLPIAKTSFAGVIAVYLPYKTVVGFMKYTMSVDEIYDVKIVPSLRPSIISADMDIHKAAYALGQQSFWKEPEKSQSQSQPSPKSYSTQVIKNVALSVIKKKFAALINNNLGSNGTYGNMDIMTALVVVLEQKPAAMALIRMKGEKSFTVPSFKVLPDHYGRGVEQYLVRQIDIIAGQNKINWDNRSDFFDEK
jgi:uncharacterized protein (TIGR03032 family)